MQEICPNAWLLNYANPLSMNMQTLRHTSGVKAVGLCHSVQGTFEQLCGYLHEDPKQVSFTCAGINHMAFYLQLEKAGVDLYPCLFEAMERPEVYDSNRVRFEIMRRLGYFVTESSEHSAEYSSWFIPHGGAHVEHFRVPIDEYLRRCDRHSGEFEDLKKLCRSDAPIKCVKRSHEYGSAIIHSLVSGEPIVVYGNMVNDGVISNLPGDAIVEATHVDQGGMHMEKGPARNPPQLVGYIQPHLTQHELFIRAAMENRRDFIYQACLFDPLTAATLTPDQIVHMCDELIAAHGDALPPLNKPTRVPCSGKTFGKANPEQLRASWLSQKTRARS